jgi:multidrug efflux pump subunit AcrB
MGIIAFSTKHPVSVLMFFLALLLLGIGSVLFIPIDMMPHISARKIIVAAKFEGVSASEMRKMVTVPLEDSLAALKGVKNLNSLSRDGLSLIEIELHWGTVIDMAVVECREIIDICFETLPSQCEKPLVVKNDSSKTDTVSLVIQLKGDDLVYARYLVDTDIKPRFQRINGVGTVDVAGGEKEEIKVVALLEQMEGRGLGLEALAGKLAQTNMEAPAGSIREGEKELLVKTNGLYTSLDDIAKTPLVYNESGMVKLSDVAQVIRGKEEKKSFFLYNGNPAIKIGLRKKQDASPFNVSRDVKDEITRLESLYGNEFSFVVDYDQADSVFESITQLFVSALAGMAISALVIYLFFRQLHFSAIIASIVPISAFITVFVLYVLGQGINTMSLSGIAIGVGMVIDNSTIVVENLQKQMVSRNYRLSLPLINTTVAEVKLSNIGSTTTTVIVFIPILLMTGLLQEVFSGMAVAIISSICAACLLSLTYVPALFTLVYRSSSRKPRNDRILVMLEEKYKALLEKAFVKKPLVVIISFALLVIGFAAMRLLPFELFPVPPDNNLLCQTTYPYGTRIEYMEEEARTLYRRLSRLDFIERISIAGGIESDDYTTLVDPAARAEKIVFSFALREKASENDKRLVADCFQGTEAAFTFLDAENTMRELFSGYSGTSRIAAADSPESAAETARKYTENTNSITPFENVKEFVFTPDRVAASRAGINTAYIASFARNALLGIDTSPFYEDGREIPVKVYFREDYIDTIDKIESLSLYLADGSRVPLRAVGRMAVEEKEKLLYRYNRKDAKIIASVSELAVDAAPLIDPSFAEKTKLIRDSVLVLVAVALLLYLAMGAQFESFLLPVYFLVALPPALSGSFIFMAIFRKTMNINSVIALVVLFGIVVNNSIILYESISSRKRITPQSVAAAAAAKFRAILLTNATTILALLPFAFDVLGGNAQSSLAITLMGGLFVSTLLVMFAVPLILYGALRKKQNAAE